MNLIISLETALWRWLSVQRKMSEDFSSPINQIEGRPSYRGTFVLVRSVV